MVRVVSIGRPVSDLLADPKVLCGYAISYRMKLGWSIQLSSAEVLI